MEVYYLLVALTLAALIVQIHRNRVLDGTTLATCALVIALIAGLRWYTDVDYGPYAEMFNDNPTLGEFDRYSIAGLYGEPGYLLLTAVFKSLGSQFFMLAFACALVSLLLKSIVVYRLSRHASLALCLYLCLHFITIEFIQMRWAVASSFIALGFYFQYLQKHRAAVVAFALSLAFHYFSILFWFVALAVSVKGHRRFYILMALSILAAVFLKMDYLARFLVSDSDIYVLSRITRYATDPDSHVGLFSYAKLIMYPAIYGLCVWCRPSYEWKADRLNLFLLKVSLVSLSVTLLIGFIPILHFRATVLADFFAIIWILNALSIAVSGGVRTVALAGLSALYCTWYLIDVRNYVDAGRLYDYQTWLTALR